MSGPSSSPLILNQWTNSNNKTKIARSLLLFLIIILSVNVRRTSGDGENCMQKGTGPQDLYKNGIMNQRYMWYRVGKKIQVPVVIDHAYTYKERGVILGGLGEIQQKTCVDFYVFNHTGALQGYDYVYITKQKEGCWSHVGRVGGGEQELSLSRGCINHRTAVHEMIHALGFTHEHVRADRDEYVQIIWANIQKGRERNFVKRNTKGRDPYGPYDYGSIMHYDRRAFSVNREDTIRPLKGGARIGLGQTMSYWDTKRILHMYKCGDDYGGGYGGGGSGYGYSDPSNHLDGADFEGDINGPPGIQDNGPHEQHHPQRQGQLDHSHGPGGHLNHHSSPGGHLDHHHAPGGHLDHHAPGGHLDHHHAPGLGFIDYSPSLHGYRDHSPGPSDHLDNPRRQNTNRAPYHGDDRHGQSLGHGHEHYPSSGPSNVPYNLRGDYDHDDHSQHQPQRPPRYPSPQGPSEIRSHGAPIHDYSDYGFPPAPQANHGQRLGQQHPEYNPLSPSPDDNPNRGLAKIYGNNLLDYDFDYRF